LLPFPLEFMRAGSAVTEGGSPAGSHARKWKWSSMTGVPQHGATDR
jgi:hypothetical protein